MSDIRTQDPMAFQTTGGNSADQLSESVRGSVLNVIL